jgi:N-acylneuraminate cytidylyltransferase
LVSTEDSEIAQVACEYGAEVIDRPMELAMDDSPTEPVILHALDVLRDQAGCDPEWVVLLQATSPLRDSADLERAFEIRDNCGADCVVSVTECREFRWREETGRGYPCWNIEKRPRRQELTPDFVENGAIYITHSKLYRQNGNRLGGTIALCPLAADHAVDVDEPFDLFLVRKILEYRQGQAEAGK